MNFDLTEERQMLQDGLRRFLREKYTPQTRADILHSDNGYSAEIWNDLAEMGVIAAMFDEDDGGFGGAGFDLSLVFEELGRVGSVEPLIDTAVIAGGLIASKGTDKQKVIIEEIISGTKQLAFAHTEPNNRYENSIIETTAKREGDSYIINGRKAVVVNADAADHLIISCRTSGTNDDKDGISLFYIAAHTAGITLQSYPLFSGGRASEVILDSVIVDKASLLGAEGEAYEAIESTTARAIVAISSEAVGLMETIKTLTIDYLQTRKQFGTAIGKFQALQHRMADMAMEIEQARSAVINLAGNLDEANELREKHVSATKNLIGYVAKLVVEESIQLHGGIGMTEEYELGHLAKRLLMTDHRFGDATHHLERFIGLAVA